MSTATATATSTWVIDNYHSEVHFKVKHLVITTVTGKFNSFSGKVVTENDDFTDAKISFNADINSISTGAEGRDNHLKSADFFDAESHPQLTFESTGFSKKGGDYILNGDLTIRGVTKPVELNVEFLGIEKDPFYGKTKAGFEINGKIHRKDFGLQWDVLTESGGAVVSNEVKLHANIQLDKEA
ncbi:MAG TPA: YceI family protein [Chitinophagaceae bacterium]|nr:YceI family protein [Chitinophagaceae bacterium]